MQPLVSIIIPTYNRVFLLGQTLDSVLAQTYQNWECIIVDDGSEDATDELIEFYSEIDSRIKYYHRPISQLKGANACRNFGFEMSMGKYIQWLDSDDIIDSYKIEKQLIQLLKFNSATIAICRWQFFDIQVEEVEFTNEYQVYKNFDKILAFIDALAVSGGFLPAHAYLVNRELICQAGNWMENLTINQDGEFFARIFVKAKTVIFVNDALVYYRRNNKDSVSYLSTELKMDHAILSWQLIESYFKIHFGESTRLVEISKKYLYRRFFKVNNKMINENKLFFEVEILRNKFSLKKTIKDLVIRILKK
ncbi:glycosyltransferase family 2 protein [Gillisia hiemivivida]|uniref:Glycosyltransferase family 2 protein n=1 Tax=Gillisia hiemivivida TaxID=291190 RepID=A0A5C6ZT45_9FLAO|nr:glycosyltransferase family 2 protein [Gillisia hiemivivida]TXD93885.1 glycosyltransferase family 2 protein [Gillisia hiemivivida]